MDSNSTGEERVKVYGRGKLRPPVAVNVVDDDDNYDEFRRFITIWRPSA